MRYIRLSNTRGSKPTNPFMQAFGLIVGIVAFATAVFIGGIVLAAIIGIVLVGGIILYVRVWWLMRKAGIRKKDDSFVDAEYEVIDTSTADDDRRGSVDK